MALLRRVYPREQIVEAHITRNYPRRVVGRGIHESTLYDIDVSVRGVRLALLEKVFDTPYSSADAILQKHTELKRRGIPTIPLAFTHDEEPKSLFVTDLTRGGRGVCLSTMDWESDGARHGVQCGKYRFFSVSNPERAVSNFADLIVAASRQGIVVSHGDVFFLVIDEAQNGKIILGDLGRLDFIEPTGDNYDCLLQNNANFAQGFLRGMNGHLEPWLLSTDRFDARLRECSIRRL